MFLISLNSYQRKMFLQLCQYVVNSNNEVTIDEKKVIELYSKEMNIEPNLVPNNGDLDFILNEITRNAEKNQINIITFEIIALILCDNILDINEYDFLEKLKEKLGVNREKIQQYISLVEEYTNIYKKISGAIFNV